VIGLFSASTSDSDRFFQFSLDHKRLVISGIGVASDFVGLIFTRIVSLHAFDYDYDYDPVTNENQLLVLSCKLAVSRKKQQHFSRLIIKIQSRDHEYTLLEKAENINGVFTP